MSIGSEMRNWLLLALLLYDVIASGNRPNNYDYEDIVANKRQSFDDHRNWRKKALQKSFDLERDDMRRYDNYNPRYADDVNVNSFAGTDRQRDIDQTSSIYKSERRYDDFSKAKIPSNIRSSEVDHPPSYIEKDGSKKPSIIMNCQRQHERFEPCFAGCAAVTCDNPRERLRPCYPFCEPGCVCIQPYVRDDRTHKCVLPEDCSKGLKGIPDLGEEV